MVLTCYQLEIVDLMKIIKLGNGVDYLYLKSGSNRLKVPSIYLVHNVNKQRYSRILFSFKIFKIDRIFIKWNVFIRPSTLFNTNYLEDGRLVCSITHQVLIVILQISQ